MSEYNTVNTTDALGWDDVISEESGEFVLLPDGEYPFRVINFERGYHNGSDKLPKCPKATLTIEVDGGAKGKAVLTHNLFLSRKTEGLLSAFFIAIGQKQHGQPLRMDWPKVPGATGRCKLGTREYKGNQYNEIKRFLEPSAAPAPAPAFAPPRL